VAPHRGQKIQDSNLDYTDVFVFVCVYVCVCVSVCAGWEKGSAGPKRY